VALGGSRQEGLGKGQPSSMSWRHTHDQPVAAILALDSILNGLVKHAA
jgi:hypothetical protein